MAACFPLFLVLIALVTSGADAVCSNVTTVEIAADPLISIPDGFTKFTCVCSGKCNITAETWHHEGSDRVNDLVLFRDFTTPNETVGPDYEGRVRALDLDGSWGIMLGPTKKEDEGWWSCNLATEECPEGVNAKLLQLVLDDPCSRQPCQNGGTCRGMGNDYDCECHLCYTGRHCEKVVTVSAATRWWMIGLLVLFVIYAVVATTYIAWSSRKTRKRAKETKYEIP